MSGGELLSVIPLGGKCNESKASFASLRAFVVGKLSIVRRGITFSDPVRGEMQ